MQPNHLDPDLEAVVGILGQAVIGLPNESGTAVRFAPTSNAAERFRNGTFALRSYCWCDGNEHPDLAPRIPGCPLNFEHFASGISGTWYKYLGRSTYFSREANDNAYPEALFVLMDCLASLGEQIPGLAALPHSLVTAEARSALGWTPSSAPSGCGAKLRRLSTTIQPL